MQIFSLYMILNYTCSSFITFLETLAGASFPWISYGRRRTTMLSYHGRASLVLLLSFFSFRHVELVALQTQRNGVLERPTPKVKQSVKQFNGYFTISNSDYYCIFLYQFYLIHLMISSTVQWDLSTGDDDWASTCQAQSECTEQKA